MTLRGSRQKNHHACIHDAYPAGINCPNASHMAAAGVRLAPRAVAICRLVIAKLHYFMLEVFKARLSDGD
eukprot:scaffold586353_cov23-Prasinocladus_malaysianus.AAC.1